MMEKNLKNQSEREPDFSVTYAFAQAARLGRELPPGELVQLNRIEWGDRHFILDQFARLGPIFKALEVDKFFVCIVGLKECARFLQEHDADITPIAPEVESLFPKGLLRQIGGEDHQHYREALVRAISSTTTTLNSGMLETIIVEQLAHYAAIQEDGHNQRDAFIETLKNISSGMLIQLFFGARYGSAPFKKLMESYQKLGPHEIVWTIQEQQEHAYAEIRDQLVERISEQEKPADEWLPQSIMGAMSEHGTLDETSLGNLIYMVEMGRYDTYGLFRWLTKFAVENNALVDRLALECKNPPKNGKSLTEAFVMETLRLEQIERLGRRVNRDIIFRNYLIPKHATVRLCLWESHKSPKSFPDPFVFNPERFIEKGFTSDQYAPFGLGKHRCPMSNFVIKMSTLFLSTLAAHYSLESIENGPPIKGVYHWEPAWKFAPRLKKAEVKESSS
jgi:cytochrome P450